jgi:membrane associated rhomboid family serine protease
MNAQHIGKKFIDSVALPLRFVGLLWVIHLAQTLLNMDWGFYGLYPREVFGLRGILTAPLLHGDWAHLLSNSVPLLMMGIMIMFFYRRVAIPTFVSIYLMTGLLVWLFGRSVFHIGASGLVYGLVAFVFWTGIFRRNLKSIVLSLIVVFYYGSMFLGILPGQEGISWESHLLGAVAGIIAAFWFKNSIEEDERPRKYSWEEDPRELDREYFLDRDIFEKTKEERLRETRNRRESSEDRWHRSDFF